MALATASLPPGSWVVTDVRPATDGAKRAYPWHVSGYHHDPGARHHGQGFSWQVPSLDNPRYVFANP